MRLIKIVLPLIFLFTCREVAMAMGEPEDIVSLSISYAHMTRMSAYEYKIEDVNGSVLFSCKYFNDDHEEVVMEKVRAEPEYMDEAREIVRKHGFAGMKYKEPGVFQRQISDAPAASMTMYWHGEERGAAVPAKRLLLNYHPPGSDELKEFFKSLAKNMLTIPIYIKEAERNEKNMDRPAARRLAGARSGARGFRCRQRL